MAEAAASGDPAEARGFEALGDANRREILRILSHPGQPLTRPAV